MRVAATQRERGVGGRPGGRGDTVDPVLVEAGGDQRLDELPGLRHPELLEPRQQLVLGVGRIERAERGLTFGARDRLPLQRDERLGVARARCPTRRTGRPSSSRTSSASAICAAARRAAAAGLFSSWASPAAIVPSDGQPLAVLLERRDAAHHRRDLLHHAPVHRRVRERQAAEVLGLDRARATHAGSARPSHAERRLGQHRDRAHPGRRGLAADGSTRSPSRICVSGRALEQQLDARHQLVLLGDHRARLDVAHRRDRDPLGELRRRRARRTGRRSAARPRSGRTAHGSTRYWWISETAIEPSPTALATRLIERARTSPATNTPGTLVSSRNGSRCSGQPRSADLRARQDEAPLVARDDALEPVGAGRRADEDEARIGVDDRLRAVRDRARATVSAGRPRPPPPRRSCPCGRPRSAAPAICSTR